MNLAELNKVAEAMLVIELGIFKPVEKHLFRWRPATKF